MIAKVATTAQRAPTLGLFGVRCGRRRGTTISRRAHIALVGIATSALLLVVLRIATIRTAAAHRTMLLLRAIAIAAILAGLPRLPRLTWLPIGRVGLIGVLRILWWMLLAFTGMMLFASRPLWPLLRRAATAGAIRRHATLSLATTWRGMLWALRLAGRCGWHITTSLTTSLAGALLLVDPDSESTPRWLFRLGRGRFRGWRWHHSSGLLSGFWLLAARVTHP